MLGELRAALISLARVASIMLARLWRTLGHFTNSGNIRRYKAYANHTLLHPKLLECHSHTRCMQMNLFKGFHVECLPQAVFTAPGTRALVLAGC